jgi:hypothetical protein
MFRYLVPPRLEFRHLEFRHLEFRHLAYRIPTPRRRHLRVMCRRRGIPEQSPWWSENPDPTDDEIRRNLARRDGLPQIALSSFAWPVPRAGHSLLDDALGVLPVSSCSVKGAASLKL